MAKYIVEKDFDSSGLRCIVVFQRHGHRCGYVGVPMGHPLYGKDYDEHLDIKKSDIEAREVSGIFPLLGTILDEDERIRIEAYFSCHGGITYSGGGEKSVYPIESDLWWFGFDCAHYGDGKDFHLAMQLFPEHAEQIMLSKQLEDTYPTYDPIRDLDYVVSECVKLAEQISKFK